MSSPTRQPLVAHVLKPKVFLVPTWCDQCGGVLVGQGFQCDGPCQLRCHRGLGANKSEHCRAEFLLKPCQETAHVQGQYKFGDVTKQIFRNEHQRIKDLVMKEAVKEQRSFGKFDKLKAYSEAVQEKWDEHKVKQYLLFGLLGSNLAIFLLAFGAVFVFAWPIHGAPRAHQLAWLEAVSNFCSLSIFEVLLLLALHLLTHQLLLYSALLHCFAREILNIDLAELEINLARTSTALSEVTFFGLQICAAVAVLAVSMWFRALFIVYDGHGSATPQLS